jgi:nitrate/TMAO reductase-like tetraheme cytochrome c subunit
MGGTSVINRRLPDVFYNWISAVGALVAAVAAAVIASLVALDLLFGRGNVYLGILTYLALPGALAAGLALVLLGALWERRKRSRGEASSRFPRRFELDLTNPVHRNASLVTLVVGVLFLLGTGLGTYQAYHVTESTAFCGQVCHGVMKPEATAHRSSPHARVTCVQCHIGPGADWFVKSKMSGAYQLYATAFDKYPRPIPTPVKNLRPARETCLQCHWPEKFFGSRRNVYPHYLSDEKNTPYPISLLLHIGGGSAEGGPAEGIHWHMAVANKLEYIARDPGRQEIAWVKVTDRAGKVTEYRHTESPLTDEERAKAEVRTMDCMDCHNRPSHIYRSPQRAVNQALAAGEIDRTLPFMKREAVKALDAEYPDTPSALAAIEAKLTSFYAENHPETSASRAADVKKSVEAVQRAYTQNMFPEMKVSWRSYPDHLGHFQYQGCFRCHGSPLTSAEGKTITNDCNACHSILGQGLKGADLGASPAGLSFVHPVDVGGAEAAGACTMCHSGGAELY